MAEQPSGPGPGGAFVVSLDFELYWGVRAKQTLASCEGVLRAVPGVVDRTLALFRDRGVRATWATVGMLMCESAEDLAEAAPATRPAYTDARLSPYPYIEEAARLDPRTHFAPDAVEKILATPGQEVGSHTFCHYFCLAPGQTTEAFRSDLEASLGVARRHGAAVRSLVFPRNQVNAAYLPLLASAGVAAYRGNPTHWAYRPAGQETAARRAFRLLDAYVSLSGSGARPWPRAAEAKPVDVPASRFLRPWSPRLARLEPLRLRRITRALTLAARRGEVFHLWWHPHNFAAHPEPNFAFLNRVLDHVDRLHHEHGMRRQNMADIADAIRLGGGGDA